MNDNDDDSHGEGPSKPYGTVDNDMSDAKGGWPERESTVRDGEYTRPYTTCALLIIARRQIGSLLTTRWIERGVRLLFVAR